MHRFRVLLTLVAAASIANAQRGPTARLVKEIVIDNASLPDGFTPVGAVVVGPGGRLYVEQSMDNVVRLFDSAGKYLKAIGAKGQGPGETENLGGIGFVGDTLWTYDWGTRRFAFFSATGTYQSTLIPPRIVDSAVKSHPVSIGATTPLAGGNLYFAGASYASNLDLALMPPIARLIGTRDGRILDTIAMSDSLGRGSFGYASGSRQTFTNDPFFSGMVDKSPLVTVGGRGAWFVVARRADCATQTRYLVARISFKRDTLWRATIECPRVAVPRNFVDSVVAVNRDRAVKMLPITASYAEQQIRPKIGDVKAFTPARALMVGGDGSTWVRPMRAVTDSAETWIRADARASAPEEFTLPPKARLKYIADATHIWVMLLDEDDLPSLVRYRRSQ
jgi:hypothetical protein